MIVQKLDLFLSPSTVRNILRRDRPRESDPEKQSESCPSEKPPLLPCLSGIVSRYPNHVWSVDRTIVRRWLVWPTYVLVAIDHYSRKVVWASPLEGPNSAWTIECLRHAIETFGAPRHIITDQEPLFTGNAFKDLLQEHGIQHRLGAVGKHGSIAVTERVIQTLKYEWLHRVVLIKGFDHLNELCRTFMEWYNQWRPHSTLQGATPNDIFFARSWKKPPKDAKTIPASIEVKHFAQARITAYRLRRAA